VYHLASVRLRDLCEHLDINSELRSKIWTCFEHILVHDVDMMMDRNIDQLIMCAIYVMSKVTGNDKPFQEIMKCYRLQPQAQSHVSFLAFAHGLCLPTSAMMTSTRRCFVSVSRINLGK
jgi:hypothetical protein